MPFFPLALPFDRLAANIADMILFVPLVSVALALLKKQIVLTQLLGTQPQLHAYFVFYGAAVVGLGWLYQVFFLTLTGTTPGKFFFGLRVIDVWTKRAPDWQKVIFRSVLWWLDVILILPLLALFFDSHRRPMHDRMADTVVVNLRNRSTGLPTLFESFFSKTLFCGMTLVMVLWAAAEVWGLYSRSNRFGLMVKSWVGGTSLCADVDRALRTWPAEISSDQGRLRVAMALFAAGATDAQCLDAEAESLIWKKQSATAEKALSYLAKAFSQMEGGANSDTYLDRVCEIDRVSEACAVTELMELFRKDKKNGGPPAEPLMKKLTSEYGKIWAARYFYARGKMDALDGILAELSLNPSLSHFLSEFRIKSLWKKNEWRSAEAAFQIYWENGGRPDRSENASMDWWLCDRELLRGCENSLQPSCRVFEEKFKRAAKESFSLPVSLTLLRKKECEKRDGDLVSSTGGERFPPEFVAYVEQLKLPKTAAEKNKNLLQIVTLGHYSESVRRDAAYRMIRDAQNPSHLKELTQYWLKQENDGEWLGVGEMLFDRFVDLKDHASALRLSERLYELSPAEENARRKMLAHFHTGDKKMAWEFAKKLGRREKRQPAGAASGYEDVRRQLSEEFGGL